MSARDGGPAFPTATQVEQNQATGETTLHQYLSDGMTLRDYFAAKALQGHISNTGFEHPANIDAKNAYIWADAMLAEREKS